MLLLVNLLLASCVMFVAWLFYLRLRNPGIVDVFWGVVIFLTCALPFCLSSIKISVFGLIFLGVTFLWALRLSGFLYWTRVRHHKIEHRYESMRQGWKRQGPVAYMWHFQFQALLSLFVSAPAYAIATSEHPLSAKVFVTASVIAIVFIIAEWVADFQLYNFVKMRDAGSISSDQVICKKGFWKWVRHPNYTFEIGFWICCAIMSSMFTHGFWGWISPLFMYLLMRFVTGRITERESIKRRGKAYIDYINETGMFLPKLFNAKKRG